VSQKAILITGGARYIGSQVLLQLQARGERVVALVVGKVGEVGKVGDRQLLVSVLRAHDIDTVMHFAANTIVPESVRDPLKCMSECKYAFSLPSAN
jgi:UDP-glucose 4-epimerase